MSSQNKDTGETGRGTSVQKPLIQPPRTRSCPPDEQNATPHFLQNTQPQPQPQYPLQVPSQPQPVPTVPQQIHTPPKVQPHQQPYRQQQHYPNYQQAYAYQPNPYGHYPGGWGGYGEPTHPHAYAPQHVPAASPQAAVKFVPPMRKKLVIEDVEGNVLDLKTESKSPSVPSNETTHTVDHAVSIQPPSKGNAVTTGDEKRTAEPEPPVVVTEVKTPTPEPLPEAPESTPTETTPNSIEAPAAETTQPESTPEESKLPAATPTPEPEPAEQTPEESTLPAEPSVVPVESSTETPKDSSDPVVESHDEPESSSSEDKAPSTTTPTTPEDSTPTPPNTESTPEEDSWESKDENSIKQEIEKNFETKGSRNKQEHPLIYDRDFLLGFRDQCTEKPNSLNLDFIAPASPSRGASGSGGKKKDFASRKNSGPQKTTSRARSKNNPKPPRAAAAPVPKKPKKQVSEEEAIIRKIQLALNQLTPETFSSISSQLIESGEVTDQFLDSFIQMLFDKAVLEPKYSSLYSQLCKSMLDQMKPQPGPTPAAGTENKKPVQLFKSTLLKHCQKEFEARPKLSDLESMEANEREEAYFQARKRMRGNMKFVGELYKDHIIPNQVLELCFGQLLHEPDNTSIEALCELLSTVGKRFETSKGDSPYFPGLMDQLAQLSTNTELMDLRIRFMIKDIIDLRKRKWVPRQQEETPLLLSEVHKQIEQKDAIPPPGGRKSQGSRPGDRDRDRDRDRDQRDRNSSRGGGGRGGGGDNKLLNRYTAQPRGNERHTSNRGGGGGGPRGSQSVKNAPVPAESSSSDDGFTVVTGGARPKTNRGSTAAPVHVSHSKFGKLPAENIESPGRRAQPVRQRQPEPEPEPKEVAPVKKVGSFTENTLEELYSLGDLDEALVCFKDFQAPEEQLNEIVSFGLNYVFRKNKETDLLSDLIVKLHTNGIEIPIGQFVTGLGKFFEGLEDLVEDFPAAPKRLGGFLAGLYPRYLPNFKFLSESFEIIDGPFIPASIVSEILNQVISKNEENFQISSLELTPRLLLDGTLANLKRQFNFSEPEELSEWVSKNLDASLLKEQKILEFISTNVIKKDASATKTQFETHLTLLKTVFQSPESQTIFLQKLFGTLSTDASKLAELLVEKEVIQKDVQEKWEQSVRT